MALKTILISRFFAYGGLFQDDWLMSSPGAPPLEILHSLWDFALDPALDSKVSLLEIAVSSLFLRNNRDSDIFVPKLVSFLQVNCYIG